MTPAWPQPIRYSPSEGARRVKAFNGYGERCGNANLSTILPTLVLKLKMDCKAATNLTKLTSVSRLLSELANLHHDERQPYVGASAFTRPVPVDAVQKLPHFGHIEPASVGNVRRFLLSDQAGRSTILNRARQLVPMSPKCKEIRALTNQQELEHLEAPI